MTTKPEVRATWKLSFQYYSTIYASFRLRGCFNVSTSFGIVLDTAAKHFIVVGAAIVVIYDHGKSFRGI